MAVRVIKKSLAGSEDLLLGFGTELQVRNDKNIEITKINAGNIPYDENKSISDSITKKVDTLADMIAMEELPVTVWCSGYHTKNDGAFGSHIFRLKGVKTTDTDNGGTVIIATIGGVDYVYELQFDGAVNVKWFGAKGDGVTDDTVAIQSAIDFCHSSNSTLLFTDGEYKLSATKDGGIYANTSLRIYYALHIGYSNLKIKFSKKSTLLLKGKDTDLSYAFFTPTDVNKYTLSGISLDGINFNFLPIGGSTNRLGHFVSIENLSIMNSTVFSSGSRFGATITIHNCKDVNISNYNGRNITQGFNLRYVEDVNINNIMFDNFSEAIDFDSVAVRVNLNNAIFLNGGQCLDCNSVQDSSFSNIKAKDCGNLSIINFKSTTHENYSDYILGNSISSYTVSSNISFSNISTDNCNKNYPVISIGQTFNTNVNEVCKNISIDDIYMKNSGGLAVESCRNFNLTRAVFESTYETNASGFAALLLSKTSYVNSELSFTLKDVTITNQVNGKDAIRVSGAEYARISNILIENCRADAIEISSIIGKSSITLENITIVSDSDTGRGLFIVALDDEVNMNTSNISISSIYSTPIDIGDLTTARALPRSLISLGKIQLSAGQTTSICAFSSSQMDTFVGDLRLTSETVAPAATNYIATQIFNGGAIVGSGSTSGGITEGSFSYVGFLAPEALAEVASGDMLKVKFTAVGSGQTLNAAAFEVRQISFLKI